MHTAVMIVGSLVLAACPSSSSGDRRGGGYVAPHDPPAPPRRVWRVMDDGTLEEVPDVVVIPVPQGGPEPMVDGVEEL